MIFEFWNSKIDEKTAKKAHIFNKCLQIKSYVFQKMDVFDELLLEI